MQKKKNVIIIGAIVIVAIIVAILVLRSTKVSNYIDVLRGKPTTWELAHIDKTEKDLNIPTVIDNKMDNFTLLSNYTKIKIYQEILLKTKKFQNGGINTLDYNIYLNSLQNRLEKSNLIDMLGFTKKDVDIFINNNLNEAYYISQSAASEPMSFYVQYANNEINESQKIIDNLQKQYSITWKNPKLQQYLGNIESIIYGKNN